MEAERLLEFCYHRDVHKMGQRNMKKRLMQQVLNHIYLLRFAIRVTVELHNLHST